MNETETVKAIYMIICLMKSIKQMELGETPDMSLQDCACTYIWLCDNFKYTNIWCAELSNDLGRRLMAIKKLYEEVQP